MDGNDKVNFEQNLINITLTSKIQIVTLASKRNVIVYCGQAAILLLISALIIIGNALVIKTLLKVKNLESTTKQFIFSLCVADLLVGVILIPLRLNEVLYADWSRTITWCKLTISMNILNLTASSLNLLALSIEKLLYLWKPLFYERYITVNRSITILSCLWIFTFLISFFPIFSGIALRDNATRDNDDFMCKYATTLKKPFIIWMVTAEVIPLIVFAGIYYQIFCTARKQLRKIKHGLQNQASSKQVLTLKKREQKNTCMLSAMVFIFYICWTPAIVAEFLSIFASHLVIPNFIFAISAIVYFNSFINSVVYYFFNEEFRKFYQQFFCFWKKAQTQIESHQVHSFSIEILCPSPVIRKCN